MAWDEAGIGLCDMCGEHTPTPGDVYCERCRARDDGYSEGSRNASQEFLEIAVTAAVENGVSVADIVRWAEAAAEGRPKFTPPR